jgi:hypothetical protein
VDLFDAKSRVAKALVESIFRRARFDVHPLRAESAPRRIGGEDISPDFSVTRHDGEGGALLLAVWYRTSIEQFVSVETRRAERSTVALARRQWPTLRIVLVTDRPEPGRSCFQALLADEPLTGASIHTADLVEARELEIFSHNITDHEQLLQRILRLLAEV